jgi:hypothetical protein
MQQAGPEPALWQDRRIRPNTDRCLTASDGDFQVARVMSELSGLQGRKDVRELHREDRNNLTQSLLSLSPSSTRLRTQAIGAGIAAKAIVKGESTAPDKFTCKYETPTENHHIMPLVLADISQVCISCGTMRG